MLHNFKSKFLIMFFDQAPFIGVNDDILMYRCSIFISHNQAGGFLLPFLFGNLIIFIPLYGPSFLSK